MEPRPDHGEKSYRGSNRLSGRRPLVTGGDSGIGRAAYAREDPNVAINYWPAAEASANEVIALIEASGQIALALSGDLSDRRFCQQLVADFLEGPGGLDIVVNNAGR